MQTTFYEMTTWIIWRQHPGEGNLKRVQCSTRGSQITNEYPGDDHAVHTAAARRYCELHGLYMRNNMMSGEMATWTVSNRPMENAS